RFYRIVNKKKSPKFARRSPPRPVRMCTAFGTAAERAQENRSRSENSPGEIARRFVPVTDTPGSLPMMNRRLFRVALLSSLVLARPAATTGQLRADDKPAAEGPSQLAKQLIGTWVLAGTPEKVEEPPANGGRYKFFTGKHWCVTQADPDSGEIIYHHG